MCDNVCEQSVEKLGIPKEEMTNKIMETVAFALCTEEEQKMLIEAKIKKLIHILLGMAKVVESQGESMVDRLNDFEKELTDGESK